MSRIKAGKYKEKDGISLIKISLRRQWRLIASRMAKLSDEKYRKAERDIRLVRIFQG